MPRRSAGVRGPLVLLVAAIACANAGCRPARPPSFEHIVLISIDTLRADFLGCYGHPYVRTPNIDGLAREGLLFEQHISVVPATLPSHTSLMTGTYPRTHGTPDNGYFVADRNVMLAELLRDDGFETAGFIGAMPLTRRFNFPQGFDHYDQPPRGQRRRRAEAVTDAALSWLGAEDRERSFVFLHYYDVHKPYRTGEPYDSMYRSDPGVELRPLSEVVGALWTGPVEVSEQSADWRARYAGGVTYVDEQIGRLLQGLRDLGLMEQSLIVVTSDHGEALDRHPQEYFGHGRTVFDATARTPLILRFPGAWRGGRRIPQLVANIDVAPTLLDLLGQPAPPGMEGVSLVPLLRGEALPVRDAVFLEATHAVDPRSVKRAGWRNELKTRGVRTARWKLVYEPLTQAVSLFDLEADPEELHKISSQEGRGAVGPELRAKLDAWAARPTTPVIPTLLQAEVREQLRALGYAPQ